MENQTLSLIVTLLASTVSIVAFSFMTFATKKELERAEEKLRDTKDDMDKRLERIENKIDRLIEKDGSK